MSKEQPSSSNIKSAPRKTSFLTEWIQPWLRRRSDRSILVSQAIQQDEEQQFLHNRGSKAHQVQRVSADDSNLLNVQLTAANRSQTFSNSDQCSRNEEEESEGNSSLNGCGDFPLMYPGLLTSSDSNSHQQKDQWPRLQKQLQQLALEFRQQRQHVKDAILIQSHAASSSARMVDQPSTISKAQFAPIQTRISAVPGTYGLRRKVETQVVPSIPELPTDAYSSVSGPNKPTTIFTRKQPLSIDQISSPSSGGGSWALHLEEMMFWLRERECLLTTLRQEVEHLKSTSLKKQQNQSEEAEACLLKLKVEEMCKEMEELRKFQQDKEQELQSCKEQMQRALVEHTALLKKNHMSRLELLLLVRENNQLKLLLSDSLKNHQKEIDRSSSLDQQLNAVQQDMRMLTEQNIRGKRLCLAILDELTTKKDFNESSPQI